VVWVVVPETWVLRGGVWEAAQSGARQGTTQRTPPIPGARARGETLGPSPRLESQVYETHPHRAASDLAELLEIADVIDAVCESLALYVPGRTVDDAALRKALFALLDHPSQELWEHLRGEWVAPNFLQRPASDETQQGAGDDTATFASEPAVSFADACYAYGLPDQVCPSKRALRAILRWAITQAA